MDAVDYNVAYSSSVTNINEFEKPLKQEWFHVGKE